MEMGRTRTKTLLSEAARLSDRDIVVVLQL